MIDASATAIVLLSGGLDSAACMHYYSARGDRVDSLFVDYGHPAAHNELISAQAISAHYNAHLYAVSISRAQATSPGFINGRNALLLDVALFYKDNPSGIVSMGLHAGSDYPDCSAGFVRLMQSLYDLYTNGTMIIDVPFIGWSKADIWEYCKQYNVPLELTYSCEAGTVPPCNKCLSCMDIARLSGK
jgi:7-cyano-7-deazaguanine synthase